MNLKRLIPLVSGITLVGTSGTLLSSNLNNQISSKEQFHSFDYTEEQFHSFDNTEEQLDNLHKDKDLKDFEIITSDEESVKDGQNFWKLGSKGSIIIGLSSEKIKDYNSKVLNGLSYLEIGGSWLLPEYTAIFKTLEKISSWQWNWWNPTSYDKGFGVVITLYGPIISSVVSQ